MSERLPYPGLRAYTRDETDLFFGREGCVNEMVNRLSTDRFLAVLGASGSGKSSLVRTGLLDGLELGLHAAAGPFWRVADLHPGGSPVRNLAAALLLAADRTPGAAEIETLESFLRRGPRGIIEWVRDGNLASGHNLLIVADQFEELFRYGDYASREEAEAFVTLLLESAAADIGIHVVITMRSEYLGACALIPGLAEQINRSLYLTRRMTREECRAAIEGPAAVVGYEVEPRLVTRLLNDLAGFAPWDADLQTSQLQRLSRQADQLPLMQHTLSRLWQLALQRGGPGRPLLTLDDYLAIGEIEGAVDRHARAVMDGLSEPARALVPRLFRALVAGTSLSDAVRRPLRFDQLVEIVGADRSLVATVVDAFRAHDCNFLRPAEDHPLTDAAIVDIGHESLIRQWRSLADWFAEEARSAALWNRLLVAAEMHRAREGELLKGLDLANASAWWKREIPTHSWAEAHGGHFDAVQDFLRLSGHAEEDERRGAANRDAAEKRTLRRRNKIYAGLLVLCVLGIGVAAIYYRIALETNNALAHAKTELETNNANLVSMTAAAHDARGRAETALKGEESANASAIDVAETFVVGFAKRLSLTPGVSKDFIDSRLAEGRDFIAKLETRMRDQQRLALTRAKFALAAGEALHNRGDYDNALATLTAAEPLLAGRDVAELVHDEVMTLAALRRAGADALNAASRYREAEERAREAIDLLGRRADLQGRDVVLALADAELERAIAQARDHRQAEAIAGARRCVDLTARPDIGDGTGRFWTMMRCHRLLTFSMWQTDPAESRKHAQAAQEAFDRIPPSDWTVPIVTQGAGVIGNIGLYLARDKQYDEARAHYVKGESLLHSFLSEAGALAYPRVRRELVWLQNGVGEAYKEQSNQKNASTAFEKAVRYGLAGEWQKIPALAEATDAAAANWVAALDELAWRTDRELLAKREQAGRALIAVRKHMLDQGHAPSCQGCLLIERAALFEALNLHASVRREDRAAEAIAIADALIEDAKAVLHAFADKPDSRHAISARRAWFLVVDGMLTPYLDLPARAPVDVRLERLEAARRRLSEFTQRFPQSWRAEKMLGDVDAALARAYLEAERTDQALKAAEEGAAVFSRDALALLADWYRTGSGPVPKNDEKARQYDARLTDAYWRTTAWRAEMASLWMGDGEQRSYSVEVFEPRSPDDDVVERILWQLEEIEGIRPDDDLKKTLRAHQAEAKLRKLSFLDLLAFRVTGTRGVTADDVAAGLKDRLAFADIEGAACRLEGWWKHINNRAMVRGGLTKLVKDGISTDDLRNTPGAAHIAPHALDFECVNNNRGKAGETDGRDLLAALADRLEDLGHPDVAGAVSETLWTDTSLGPATTASLLYLQARRHERQGEVEKAEASLAQALALRPDNPSVLNSLGYSWVERNMRLPSAIALLERAVALEPDSGHIRDSLGWAYVIAGDTANGLRLLESAAAAQPDEGEIAAHLADTLRRLGRTEEARAGFQRAAAKPGNSDKVRTWIARQMLLTEREDDIKAAAAELKNSNPRERIGISTDEIGIAIRGYDPLSYHDGGEPQVGSIRYAALWHGALWLFTSAERKSRFMAEPERYAPVFGGFCAFCVAVSHKLHADPAVWVIHKGKLYLHVNNDYRDTWRKDADHYIQEAINRWPPLQSQAVTPDKTLAVSERLLAVSR